MDPMMKYPRLRDLEPAARRRIPSFIFAYLDSGTGHDVTKAANAAFYDSLALTPQFLRGRVDPDLSVSLLGRTYNAPFGVAPACPRRSGPGPSGSSPGRRARTVFPTR